MCEPVVEHMMMHNVVLDNLVFDKDCYKHMAKRCKCCNIEELVLGNNEVLVLGNNEVLVLDNNEELVLHSKRWQLVQERSSLKLVLRKLEHSLPTRRSLKCKVRVHNI